MKVLNEIWDFISRHAVWALLIIIPLQIIANDVLQFIYLNIVLLLGLAIGGAGLAQYAYTKIPFTKKIMDGGDGELTKLEQLGANIVLGCIFLGVCILVAGSFIMLQLSQL